MNQRRVTFGLYEVAEGFDGVKPDDQVASTYVNAFLKDAGCHQQVASTIAEFLEDSLLFIRIASSLTHRKQRVNKR